MGLLEKQYPTYQLSDTVLYSALKFLEEEELITGYWQKVTGRGLPVECIISVPNGANRPKTWPDSGKIMLPLRAIACYFYDNLIKNIPLTTFHHTE